MPLYMDFHNDMQGVTSDQVGHAHEMDVEIQDQYGVKYHKFWLNEAAGYVFCLVEGPDKETCERVHQKSHGKVACRLIEVTPSEVALFMGAGQTTPVGEVVHPDGDLDSAVRTFLFTDIVGSTQMNQELGDLTAIKRVHVHNNIVRMALAECNGKEIKHTGDGIMACFVSPSNALRAAIRIQRELHGHRSQHPDSSLHVRIGLHAGEPVREQGDFFGSAVQMSARICNLCETDRIMVSSLMKTLSMGRDFLFSEIRKAPMKGFRDPQEVCELLWE